MMQALQMMNLALRFVLELCALAALGYWGFTVGKGPVLKFLLGLGTPLIVVVIWGMFGSPKAPMPVPDLWRPLFELVMFGLGAVALYAAGHPGLAGIYGAVAIVNRILMYVWHQ